MKYAWWWATTVRHQLNAVAICAHLHACGTDKEKPGIILFNIARWFTVQCRGWGITLLNRNCNRNRVIADLNLCLIVITWKIVWHSSTSSKGYNTSHHNSVPSGRFVLIGHIRISFNQQSRDFPRILQFHSIDFVFIKEASVQITLAQCKQIVQWSLLSRFHPFAHFYTGPAWYRCPDTDNRDLGSIVFLKEIK